MALTGVGSSLITSDEFSPHGTVLVVDDETANTALLQRLLTREGYDVAAVQSGEAALDLLTRQIPDVILLDVQLPGIDGFEVCRLVKKNSATRLVPVVLVTSFDAREHRIACFNAGADEFLAKPFDGEELRARVRSLMRHKRYTDSLDSAESIIVSLALTVEARDEYTQGHCERLAEYAERLGLDLNLPLTDLRALRLGGYLHDIGKIAIPDAVLLKAGRLTAEEFELMKTHTTVGDRLCGNLHSLQQVRPIVRHHHELLDGTGYPDGLRGAAVPLLAQIMGVVDVYDALTTARPYRPALSHEDAIAELRRDGERGRRDPRLIERFVGSLQEARRTRGQAA